MYDLNNVLGHIFILTLRWSGHGAENWSLLFFFPLGFPVIHLSQWSLKPLWNQSVSDKQKNDMSLHESLNTPIYPSSNHQVYLCMRTYTHKPQDTSYCSHMRSSFCSLNLASLILQILHTLLNSFYFKFICK